MEEIAEVYARALFEVASEQDALDDVRDQIDQFADAMEENRSLMQFFFSPYFSSEEKTSALHKTVEDAHPAVMNFLEALIERHRMPVIFRIRERFDRMWEEEHKLLPVEVTSAISLDDKIVREIGDQVGEQTGRTVELSSRVDPEIIGGIVLRVGNVILDASIVNRLEQLRKQVAQA